jgi:hypothetical protein
MAYSFVGDSSRAVATDLIEQERPTLKGKERAFIAPSVIDEDVAIIGPLGAKAAAAITGAVVTSLLSV